MTDKADDENPIPQQATPRKVLESRLMDPRVAEWFASREIERLKDKLHKLEQAFDALYEESSGQRIAAVMGVDSLRDQLTDKDATIASQAAEIAALREALTTIAFQSTDMPGAAVGAGDGFYRGYVFDMIGTAARALSGDTDHDHR